MREIKFREAIYKDSQFVKFHYWGYDDGGQSNAFLNSKRYRTNLDSFPEDRKLYVKANEQYTGYLDGCNNEIFDGDFFKSSVGVGKVQMMDGCWVVNLGEYRVLLSSYLKNDSTRTIKGNVHENKEYGT